MEFWEVMTPEARDLLMKAISPLVTELREFGLGSQAGCFEPPARQTPPASALSLLTNVAATTKPRSAERDAMLDLARIHDLFVLEWEEGKWR